MIGGSDVVVDSDSVALMLSLKVIGLMSSIIDSDVVTDSDGL